MDPTQLHTTPPPLRNTALLYFGAIVLVSLIGGCSVLGILYLSPDKDNTPTIGGVLGYLAIVLGQMVNFIKSKDNGERTQNTHDLVNGQSEELKKAIAEIEFLKGITQGIAEQRAFAKEIKEEQGKEFPPHDASATPSENPSPDKAPLTLPASVMLTDAETKKS